MLTFSAALLLGAAIVALIAQTGLLAGSLSEGCKLGNLEAAIGEMNFGMSAVIRAAIAAVLLLWLITQSPSRTAWAGCAVGGAFLCASLAWMGHGAATEGPAGIVHLLGDVIHSLAAAVWIGALVAFTFLLLGRSDVGNAEALHVSLRRFSGVGSLIVALIVLSGLVNTWFLVGPQRLLDFWTTAYGQMLLAKLLVFGCMLGLAALNRFRLTPVLGVALGGGASCDVPLAALRRSLMLETGAALAVLGLVAWLGTLPPPSA